MKGGCTSQTRTTEPQIVYLTRRYRFSAAHRLHNPALSEEENQALYGKCNNPYGHGHNYVLEVTVSGPVDPATGMVYSLVDLDGVVQSEILDCFEHANLNLDVTNFEGSVPTTENLCIEIFDLLRSKLARPGGGVRLARVRIEETNSNSFEYEGKNSDEDNRTARRSQQTRGTRAG